MHSELQTRIDCDKCGPAVEIVRGSNDRKVEEAVRKHAIEKHGGIDRGYG
jgi:hypothetical protein